VPYKFPLHAVLRARMAAEEREERLLQKILVQISQSWQDIAELNREMDRLNTHRGTAFTQAVQARGVHDHYGQMQELKRVHALLSDQIKKLEELKEQQIRIFQATRQDRELVAGMQDANREAYERDLARREQNALDDNFIARRMLPA
jgi:flagellar biosynthesis chaperone FliJ